MEDPNPLLLDTGDLLYYRYETKNAAGYSVKNDLIMDAFNKMEYDAVNLGYKDLYPDPLLLEKRTRRSKFPFVSANAAFTAPLSSENIKSYTIKEVNGIRIGITGVLPLNDVAIKPGKVPFITLKDPESSLREIIPELNEKTDFIILLSQLKSNESLALVEKIPGIDLILSVESKRRPLPVQSESSGETSPSPIMTILTKGMEIGILNLEKKGDQVFVSRAQRVYLDEKIPVDKEMLAMTEEFYRWKADQKKKKKIGIEHKKLMENLNQSPEEFFKGNVSASDKN